MLEPVTTTLKQLPVDTLTSSIESSGERTVTCPRHGDYVATIVRRGDREIVQPCPRCDTDTASRQARLTDGQRRLEERFGHCGIPPRYWGKGFDRYAVSPSNAHQAWALKVSRAYAERFEQMRATGRCMIFTGGPGTGKTHLACAILAAILGQGYTGMFTSVSETLRLIRSTYHPSSIRTEVEVFDGFVAPDLLVMDEVGVGIGDDTKRRAMLFDVFDARYRALKPTLLIGNLTPSEMDAYLGPAVMDRLNEAGGVIVAFDWESTRRKRQ